MTVYHMALPPYIGGSHPHSIQAPMFAPSLLPHVNAGYGLHSFPPPAGIHIPSSGGEAGGAILTSNTFLSHPSVMPQSPHFFHPTSVYISPYLNPHPMPLSVHSGHSHHRYHRLPHAPYSPSQSVDVILPCNQDMSSHFMSVDEELIDEMNKLHLSYIAAEDSPQKLEQREKLEAVIIEYLGITRHSQKFVFSEVGDILERSIKSIQNFSISSAANAFDALAQYAANILTQPWRKEFKEVKLYSGYWIHQIASHLVGAERLLALMGYEPVGSYISSKEVYEQTTIPMKSSRVVCYVHAGIADPDLLEKLSLDCLVAYCECQMLKRISEGTREFNLSWRQILEFRRVEIGGVDGMVRYLLFKLRQKKPTLPVANIPSHSVATEKQVATTSSEPPPLPARQPSSAAASPLYTPAAVDKHLPEKLPLTPTSSNVESIPTTVLSFEHGTSHPECLHTTSGNSYSRHHPAHHLNYDKGLLDGADSVHQSGPGASTSRVPTAKLIDLEPSFENSPNSQHPYVAKISQKRTLKHHSNSLQSPVNASSMWNSTQSPAEVLQPATHEEHIQATLSYVKDADKNLSNLPLHKIGDLGSSTDWDYVFKDLKRKGISKDIGHRDDILNQVVHQNSFSEFTSNSNIYKKALQQAKPLSFTNVLQQLHLCEEREKIAPLPSSKGCHSCEAHDSGGRNSCVVLRRPSPPDNISAFETALQDSDEYDNHVLPARKAVVSGSASRIANASDSSSGLSGQSPNSKGAIRVPSGLSESPSCPPVSTHNSQNPESIEILSKVENQPWSCASCTFLNSADKNVCDMCGKSRHPGAETKPLISGGRQCPICTLINDREAYNCSVCDANLEGSSTYI